MRYTVIWLKDAEIELTEIWNDTRDRKEVSKASREIDRLLANDAGRRGKPLQEGLRALDIAPLRVIFSVKEEDRIVEVAFVREL